MNPTHRGLELFKYPIPPGRHRVYQTLPDLLPDLRLPEEQRQRINNCEDNPHTRQNTQEALTKYRQERACCAQRPGNGTTELAERTTHRAQKRSELTESLADTRTELFQIAAKLPQLRRHLPRLGTNLFNTGNSATSLRGRTDSTRSSRQFAQRAESFTHRPRDRAQRLKPKKGPYNSLNFFRVILRKLGNLFQHGGQNVLHNRCETVQHTCQRFPRGHGDVLRDCDERVP